MSIHIRPIKPDDAVAYNTYPRISRVELDVFATNRSAISLYIKHGIYTDYYVMGILFK